MATPRLVRNGATIELWVGGCPRLLRAGELGNSAASHPDALREAWPRLVELNLNAVLVPVYWERCEPEEGRFDFELLDHALALGRETGLYVVPLWFGSYKNSMSCYAPGWVKRDLERFPRARLRDGTPLEILSAFAAANVTADARAFAALLTHLRANDRGHDTVPLVQVENEVGMLEDARERGPDADAAFAEAVPPALLAALATAGEALPSSLRATWERQGCREAGNWAAVFGEDLAAEELFTAWHLGRFVDQVAAAGKAVHPLPMYTNAALNRPAKAPGEYPSGGPVPHLLPVWRAAAPHLDLLSPDIYFDDFAQWVAPYVTVDQPLFVPESRWDRDAAATAFHCFGQARALGFSPFAIETGGNPEPAAFRDSYALLAALEPVLLAAQREGRTAGVLLDDQRPRATLQLCGHRLDFAHDLTWGFAGDPAVTPWRRAGALVIALDADTFLVAGTGFILTFPQAADGTRTGLLTVAEGHVEAGGFRATRRLNGDETHQGRHVRIPLGSVGVQRVEVYRYR